MLIYSLSFNGRSQNVGTILKVPTFWLFLVFFATYSTRYCVGKELENLVKWAFLRKMKKV